MSQLRNLLFHHGGVSPIPSQYIVAEYIQIATNQYIDTGVAAIPRYTRSLFDVYWVGSATGTRGLFGVRSTSTTNSNSYNVFLVVGGVGPRWDNTGDSTSSSSWTPGERHVVELTHTPEGYGQAIDNGVVAATGSIAMSTGLREYIHLNTIYTISNASVNTGGTTRWYSCKIWQDGTVLTADMIPVYDTITQAGGMYDVVRQQFYGGSNPDGNTIVAYDANDDPITGGNLLGMSPNLLMMSNKKSKLNVTMIGPDEEEER